VIAEPARTQSAISPVIAAVLIAALYLGHVRIFGAYIADDAGISLAYARNIVAGFGPVLHAGGEAVEGYSNPLWVAILGLGVALRLDGSDGIPLMKTLGVAFGLATLALTWAAARVAYPSDGRTWIAPAILAAITPFAFWATAGLENGLYAFVVLLAVTLQLRELKSPDVRQWSALALAAAALTRPEGVALFAAFLVHRVLCGARGRRLVTWMAAFLIIYTLFIGSRLLICGEWVPNTYYAKVDLYDRRLTELWRYLLDPRDRGARYTIESARALWPLLIVAASGSIARRHWRTNVLLAAVILGSALYAVYVGGDFWPAGRFFTATLPLLALAAQHAVHRWPQRPLMVSCAGAVLVGILLNRSATTSGELHVLDSEDALISLQGRLQNAHRLQALAHALGIEDPLVLDPDIGGPAVAGLRVLDLGGLTDIHIARFHYDPPLFREYIFEERRPDFIRTHASWTVSSRVTAFPEFAQQYVPIRARRDARGLHGEFVRRDLIDGSPRSRKDAVRPPSFRQAVEDGRARRAREADRARRQSSPPNER
jgi:hypothetical protein